MAGLALPFSALWSRRVRAEGWGELVPDPEGILDLPPGFTYRVLEESGDPMDDGYVVPGLPDGMACFEGEPGTVVLMRNHEVGTSDASNGAYGLDEAPPEAYDPAAFGGVTRLVLDAEDFGRISSNLVLTGTVRNCAGGTSPWGWLSCEETVQVEHGFVFLCSTEASSVAMPQRIPGYGRFRHEAAVVDPETSICYLTEDQPNGAFYRFVPKDAETDPFEGTLQAMRVVGFPNANTSSGMYVGQVLEIEWFDITNPSPLTDTVGGQAASMGAATIARGEGLWHFDDSVYISSTSGGPAYRGQIFRLIDGPEGGTLELIAQAEDADGLDHPDNITVAPWGQIFIAEDGVGDQYVRAITEHGEVIDFARNAKSSREMAGVCFSPDGRAMFLNLQHDGVTLVVTGPFTECPEPEPETGESTTGDDDGLDGETGRPALEPEGPQPAPGRGVRLDDDGGLTGCGCSTETSASGAAALVGATLLGLRSAGSDRTRDED